MSGEEKQPGALPEDAAFVIPVYNHGATVGGVVRDTLTWGRPVFVVNDGSTDGTAAALADLPGITVLTHLENYGKGAAILGGLAAAAAVGARWAVTLDADGQHHPQDAAALFGPLRPGQRALVVGRRQDMDGPDVPWTSRWGRRFSNFWVWLAGGLWMADSQSGFRVYPLPETLKLKTRTRRFQFEVEVIAKAAWCGLPVLEAPVRVVYQPPGGRISHFKPGLDFWRNTKTFTRLILQRLLVPRSWRAGRI
jgi:glycosyltransferase involved in cell wall biosynthesis